MNIKILSWNIGTKYKGDAQSYYWSVFNKFIKYGKDSKDIYCIQEVPSRQVFAPGKFAHLNSFSSGFSNDYYVLKTQGEEYSLVTLIRKSLLKKGEYPLWCSLNVGSNFSFAQKIKLQLNNEQSLTIFNIHLKAFEKKTDHSDSEKEQVTFIRNSQIAFLENQSKVDDYFCGDFNIIRSSTAKRPGMNQISWLSIAGEESKTYFKLDCNRDPKPVHEYDYIGKRVVGNNMHAAPALSSVRSVLSPGKSGSSGTYRHHPIEAEIIL